MKLYQTKAIFENEKWSKLGELRKPSAQMSAVYTNGQFLIVGADLT